MKISRISRNAIAVLLFIALTVSPAYAASSLHTVTVQDGGSKGSVTVSAASAQKGAAVTGAAVPGSGFELATVRYIYTSNGAETVGFASLSKTPAGFSYSFTMPDADVRIAAAFFSTTIWDGAVDVSWYTPDASAYDISQPAQLAGLAAIVNGLTDKYTPDYMIKGDRAVIKATANPNILLVGAGGGNVSDTVYTSTTDFAYKTVCLTADLDMGGMYDQSTDTWSGPNYTPIGGKYSMASDVAVGDSFVIDTRFNGAFDGQGHTVKNINCQRYAVKGFPYSMAVGLIGYLGGACDENGIKAVFNNGWQPSVRNVIVGKGYIYGRRMVGGVVGRTDVTNNGVIIENCANFATVKNTDSKGVGGIVGAGWGDGYIRDCYNMGNVSTTFPCPAGGICGSDGGIDIYNCYNAGKISSNGQLMGRGIGGHEEGTYTVDNCFYLPSSGDDPASPGYYLANSKSITVRVTEMTSSAMKTDAFLGLLNWSGSAYAPDTGGINNGYPILYFQAEDGRASKTFTVAVKQPDQGGAVTVGLSGMNAGAGVQYGKVVDFSCTPAAGYKLDYYTVNGERLHTDFVTVSKDVTVSAVFSEVKPVKIFLPDSADFALIVTKTGFELQNGALVKVKDKPVRSGDTVLEENIITVKTFGYNDVSPANVNLQFTDGYSDTASNAAAVSDGVFQVNGSGDVTLKVVRGTEPKTWLSDADTSWYNKSVVKASYTLTTPEQLAGLASLVNSGVSFYNTTIYLGSDISLKNNDGTSGQRLWRAIGSSAFKAFKGKFDGHGYTIRDLDAYSAGSYAGLFGCATDAVIKNVTVRGIVAGGESLSYAAGVVASASASVIDNCISYVGVTIGGAAAAGIAGYISDGTTISGCRNYGEITASSGVGGLVGVSYTASDLIKACENTGTITATGGGTSGAGGIAGKLTGTVSACVSTGSVTSDDRYTGGLIGYSSGKNSAHVLNSYNTGSVATSCGRVNAAVGGLVGYAQYITLENSYSLGLVTVGSGFATGYIGGVIGRLGVSNCKTINCYYLDTSCTAAVSGDADVNALPKSSGELKTPGFAAQLNTGAFGAPNYINNGYPILTWQSDKPICTVIYTGDFTGKTTVPSGGSTELPPPPAGYRFTFTAAGGTWTGSAVTSDVNVVVVKTQITYSAIFTAGSTVVDTAEFKYGDSTVREPAVPQIDGYTASWQPYKLNAANLTIKAVYRQDVVLGGDTITKDGIYFAQYYSTGNIELGAGIKATLNGVNGGAAGFDGLTVTLEKGAVLTLENFKSTGDSTLLTMKDANTLILSGNNALVGVCDTKGNLVQTLRLEGDTTIGGSGTLYVQSGIGNAAVYVAPGATLRQQSGTVEVKKNDLLGFAGGAVYAPEANVVISGGTFSGFTNSDNVSVISAKNITVTGGSVTAVAEKSPVTFDSKVISITGGSVKAIGHSGNSMSINRYYYNSDTMPGFDGGFAVAVVGTGWSDALSAVAVDGKTIQLGGGHIGLSGTSDGNAVDNLLYLWLTKSNHTLTVDGRSMALKWDAATSSFKLSGTADVFAVALSGNTLQLKAEARLSPEKLVIAAVCDASGKLLASANMKSLPAAVRYSGACFRLRLMETGSNYQPLTDYAYTVTFTS